MGWHTFGMAKQLTSLLFLSSFFILGACSGDKSIYQNLSPEEDGVVAIAIPEEDSPVEASPSRRDTLSDTEKDLVDRWHEGEVGELSFVVIDAEERKVLRSYFAEAPQRLASVSKITTALGALTNVRNVNVNKVKNMLKISNNGEASRYVRLAAKALDGLVIPSPHYPQKHSCPAEFLEDQLAADVVFDWLTKELSSVDWTGASFNDGAGCHYDNFMTPIQVAHILDYADSKGEAYNGYTFEELLSINGVDGTWKNKNLDHKGYIFAKTGTLRPNANLSGYFYAKRKGEFVKHYFSVFVNKKGGGSYSTKARKLIEGLMRHWINYYSQHQGEPVGDF